MPSEQHSTSRASSKKSKKKGSKVSSQQGRSTSFDKESDLSAKAKRKKKMSRVGEDIDEEKAIDYDNGEDEHTSSYNHESHQMRKNRDRKPKRSEDEYTAPYSESNMGGSMTHSKKHSRKNRSNGQPPFRSESHYDKRYIEYDHDDYMSEMGNHDPIDHYGQDYESEEDEEEPRFKYSTADLSKGDCRSQQCCLVGAGVFFILIAIAVSVLMLRLTKGEDNER